MDLPTRTPTFLIVTGHGGTGKTTLARNLAERFALPLFTKDRFKEQMYDLAAPDGDYAERIPREFSQLLGRFSLGCLEIVMAECASQGISAIFEANFRRELFSPRLAQLREQHPFSVIQIHLHCQPDILAERFFQREATDRHPGHGGLRFQEEIRARLARGLDPPLDIAEAPLFSFDTTNFAALDYEPLYAAILQQLSASS